MFLLILTVLAASGRSAGKTYEEAVGPRWAMTVPMPESVKKMMVLDASKVEEVASQVDFIFCAVNMPKDEIKALEEAYAKAECPQYVYLIISLVWLNVSIVNNISDCINVK